MSRRKRKAAVNGTPDEPPGEQMDEGPFCPACGASVYCGGCGRVFVTADVLFDGDQKCGLCPQLARGRVVRAPWRTGERAMTSKMRREDIEASIGKPRTAQEALARWDRGESVFTIEMGGLGPGHEQAIQILVFELIRDNEPIPAPDAEGMADLHGWGEAAVKRTNAEVGGYSGAQVGAAKSLASRAIKKGWAATLAEVPADRLIQISNYWPHARSAP